MRTAGLPSSKHSGTVTGNSLMIGSTAEDNEELAVTGLPRKFASRIHRHVEALAAVALWIMLSAGGKGWVRTGSRFPLPGTNGGTRQNSWRRRA